MAALVQACERKFGDSECPFHPGGDVVALCDECQRLVCVNCMTSKEHKAHTFVKPSQVIHEKSMIIGQGIEIINSTILPKIEENIQNFQNEESKINDMESSLKKSLNKRYEDCSKLLFDQKEMMKVTIGMLCGDIGDDAKELIHSQVQKKKEFEELISKLQEVLLQKSFVKIFDASQNVKRCQESFSIHDASKLKKINVVFNTNMESLIANLLGDIEVYSEASATSTTNENMGFKRYMQPLKKQFAHEIKPPLLSPSKFSTMQNNLVPENSTNPFISKHISMITSFQNSDPQFDCLTPVTIDTAWCVEYKWDVRLKRYNQANKLCLITHKGHVQKCLNTYVAFRCLSLHPITGVLYGTFGDARISMIDTNTGANNTVLRFSFTPEMFTITSNGDFIIGEITVGHVYRYSPDGLMLHQSQGKYNVYDIAYSAVNDQVAIACMAGGVIVMNGTLNKVIHTEDMRCYTTVFDVHGNLLISERKEKEIVILDGQTFSKIKTINLSSLSSARQIRIFENSIWVKCIEPYRMGRMIFA